MPEGGIALRQPHMLVALHVQVVVDEQVLYVVYETVHGTAIDDEVFLAGHQAGESPDKDMGNFL